MNEVYAVLDIGSATIELLVGEIMNSNLHVLFSKKVPSHGVKKGIIEDEHLLVNDIKAVVQEANEFLDGEIKANSASLLSFPPTQQIPGAISLLYLISNLLYSACFSINIKKL